MQVSCVTMRSEDYLCVFGVLIKNSEMPSDCFSVMNEWEPNSVGCENECEVCSVFLSCIKPTTKLARVIYALVLCSI